MNNDFSISIEKLAFGGKGVGRINGKVCFVPFSAPGDELKVRVVAEKHSYLTARILDILTPSQERITPHCPLFGSCGGCGWQHISYHWQLVAKRQILSETLWRVARVPGDLVAETIPSPLQFGYRSRVQFKLYHYCGRLLIGFFRHGSHLVEDAQQGCPIAKPDINVALHNLRVVLTDFPDPAAIPQINIDSAEHGAVGIINYIGRNPNGAIAFFKKHAEALQPLTGLYLQTGRKSTLRKVWGEGLLTYSMPAGSTGAHSCTLSFSPGGFSQINTLQNVALLEIVRKLADLKGKESVLDLYCGNGNFSLPLADESGEVTGIEGYKDSVAAAVDNCRKNGINNARFTASDAAAAVHSLAAVGRRFDVAILDPPRSGAADVVRELHRLKPERIIYISCDPNTLARDCGLLSANGYHVRSCIPVDMFPQTHHVESVTLLQQN